MAKLSRAYLHSTTTRGIGLAAVGVLLGAAWASPALADGGTSIAGAPSIVPAQQEFGNTATGGQYDGGCSSASGKTYRSWWSLAAISGDHIKVDWEAQGADTVLAILNSGATDYNFLQQDPLASQEAGGGTKTELKVVAPSTGALPLELKADLGCISTLGPYDFTVYLQHAVRLALPRVRALGRAGILAVSVHAPDGSAISSTGLSVALEMRGAHSTKYRRIGSATVANGRATVAYVIPTSLRHAKAQLRAASTGADFINEHSTGQAVKTR